MLFTVSTAVEVRTALLASICRTRALSTTRLAHSNAALSLLLATNFLLTSSHAKDAVDAVSRVRSSLLPHAVNHANTYELIAKGG